MKPTYFYLFSFIFLLNISKSVAQIDGNNPHNTDATEITDGMLKRIEMEVENPKLNIESGIEISTPPKDIDDGNGKPHQNMKKKIKFKKRIKKEKRVNKHEHNIEKTRNDAKKSTILWITVPIAVVMVIGLIFLGIANSK
ncbi:MAG: hypothetical protein QM536_04650 [Chitinophagaceae bacterium]|nr:hypothetical protein [Chitinophagaceae bacterium]